MTLQKVSHQRTMIKYINVIVSPKQTKKGTPYPQALVCNSFQYHGVFALKFCAMQENRFNANSDAREVHCDNIRK